MRIIAGEHRGRNLLPPPTDATRPITDRAKQSLFDVLSPRIEDARIADVFSGTGSMGLECLSRGGAHAHFFELNRGTLAALNKNIETLRLKDRSTVIAGDLFATFPRTFGPGTLDIVFLDPPYAFLKDKPALLQTLASAIAAALKPTGIVSFRHDTADALDLPGLSHKRTLAFGSMTIELLGVPQ